MDACIKILYYINIQVFTWSWVGVIRVSFPTAEYYVSSRVRLMNQESVASFVWETLPMCFEKY